jgi:hypothetical protein
VAIVLTFVVALSIFNVNIIQGNNGDVILPNTIEQAEALADIEISITTYYVLAYIYIDGHWVYVCSVVTVVSVCSS